MPGSLMFYPTTDRYLTTLKEKNVGLKDLNNLADFIIEHRNNMRFRMQDKKAIFYSNEALSNSLIESFLQYHTKTEIVDPKFGLLDKNSIGCDRLPHGKYQYQIHLKKDVHRHLNKLQRKTLWDFIERNVDHCLVTNKFVLDYLEGKYPHCYHGYFYVESEKFLTPIYMIAQKGIDKVIKFVKVKNGSNKKTER
jgi:hypothetical protein|tara:strand:+ start:347 stop:928 length:582 start_codon:yes stop_codon:yes gene_type:complete